MRRSTDRLNVLVLALAVLLGARAAHAAASGSGDSSLRIGKIKIVTLDVFTPEEETKGWAYRTADALHITTRESVVRRFLLFREGEAYVPEQLAESERNLRALGFLRSASVRAGPTHDGVVDVTVTTQDSWTLEPGITIGSSGGSGKFGLDVVESNFIGTGRKVAVRYKKGFERTEKIVEFSDPTLFGRYWAGSLLYSSNSDGQEQRFAVSRPFYAFETPWSFGVAADHRELQDHIYRDAVSVSDFSRRHQEFTLSYGKALRSTPDVAHRLTMGLDLERDRFDLLGGETPSTPLAGRDYRYLFAEYELVESDYVKMNFVNRDLRYEDFNLGADLRVHLGVSLSGLGADATTGLASVFFSRGFRLSDRGFVLPHVAYDTRIGPANRNATLGLGATFVRRMGHGTHPQTLVSRLSYLHGDDLDPERQFFADGATGLRGYRLHAFAGTSAAILNVEHRWFLGRELLQLISPGFAAFVDTGLVMGERTASRGTGCGRTPASGCGSG